MNGILLVGPPGSGKTTVATALAARHGYRFEDREARLVSLYGSRENFLATKEAAITAMHEQAREWMAASAGAWIYESTALTERVFVEDLAAAGAALVSLEVTLPTALARVGERDDGGNLSNDRDSVRRVWNACRDTYPSLAFDLVVPTDGRSVDEVAEQIHLRFVQRSQEKADRSP